MKALETVSEEDLLASEQVPSGQLFKAILADRDRMIDMIAERDQKIQELERALALKIEIVSQHFREAQP